MKYSKILFFSSFLSSLFFFTTMQSYAISDTKDSSELVLFDFATMENLEDWLIVNDGVMGGLSKSKIIMSDNNTAFFTGDVTLENNGGFASTRTKTRPFRLDGYKGIQIQVKGDGKKYQFRIRTHDRFDGISYRYQFETNANQWETISVPFNECVPVFRGRKLRDVETISPKDIQQLGFLISDKQTGEFQLEIKWIRAFQE